MDIAEKIRAEIQLHEAELDRLRTALGVIEQYGLAKPAKAPPLITIRKRAEPAPSKGKAIKGKAPKGTLPVKAMILQALDKSGGALTTKQIIDEGRRVGRADNSVYAGLDNLVKQGVIMRDGINYSLPGKPSLEARPSALEPGETGPEGNSEAA